MVRSVKLKTRIIISFFIIILEPLICTAAAFWGFSQYQLKMLEKQYGIENATYESLSNTAEVINNMYRKFNIPYYYVGWDEIIVINRFKNRVKYSDLFNTFEIHSLVILSTCDNLEKFFSFSQIFFLMFPLLFNILLVVTSLIFSSVRK